MCRIAARNGANRHEVTCKGADGGWIAVGWLAMGWIPAGWAMA
jgi:hypothetical protein